MTAFVLVHSPAVGPGTWVPVARVLQAHGHDAVVPDLRHVADGSPPYWPSVAATVAESVDLLEGDDAVVLVAHSNAGLLLPCVAAACPRPVRAGVYVDAALPARPGPSAAAPPGLLEMMRGMADERGVLPRWTDWWEPEDVAALLHDPAQRASMVAEQPRLPLSYYEQLLPVPESWWAVPTAYLRLSEAYDEELDDARRDGWPTTSMAGHHLHQLVDPVGVGDAVLDLVARVAAL